MTFSIGFLPEAPFAEDGANYRYARIVLGEFEEESTAELAEWVAEDYDRQWREASGNGLMGRRPTAE